MSELRDEVEETMKALCAKVRSEVMESRPDNASHYADALRDMAAGYVDVVAAEREAEPDE